PRRNAASRGAGRIAAVETGPLPPSGQRFELELRFRLRAEIQRHQGQAMAVQVLAAVAAAGVQAEGFRLVGGGGGPFEDHRRVARPDALAAGPAARIVGDPHVAQDRKSTRLNSSHVKISYAVFCLKKKKKINSTLSQ